jgi:uncharacterized protein YdeI (YjbR/CyaY-like superfamily)
MSTKNKLIDAYIAKSADFAQPVLIHLRELIHVTCPEVEEKIKWGFPHFDYKGEMMCSMASFKQHCAFNFWKAKLMKDVSLIANAKEETAMGHFGRITSLKDLPSDKKMIAYIKEAMQLNDEGKKLVKRKPTVTTQFVVPDYIIKAIKKNKKAFATFDAFPQSHKKEYALWIDEAKTEETKSKRIAQTIEWLEEGKPRNWKYMDKYKK